MCPPFVVPWRLSKPFSIGADEKLHPWQFYILFHIPEFQQVFVMFGALGIR